MKNIGKRVTFRWNDYSQCKERFKEGIIKYFEMEWQFFGKDDEGMSGRWTNGDNKITGFFYGHDRPADLTIEGENAFISDVMMFVLELGDIDVLKGDEKHKTEARLILNKPDWVYDRDAGYKKSMWMAKKKAWVRKELCSKCPKGDPDPTTFLFKDCRCADWERWLKDDKIWKEVALSR